MYGKKSSALLMMLLMMIFCISFAKNNCIFLKIFAFWNTCKRTVFLHIFEKSILNFKDLLKYLSSKWLKVAASKVWIIAISRLKNHGYWLSSCQNRFAAGLPYLILIKIGCLYVCKYISLYPFMVWAFTRLVPNTTTRGC